MSEIDLTAPEVQAAISAAVEKATAPLVAKRDELLGEVKKLRKHAEIDPADLEKVEAERDQFKQQLAEATKANGKLTKDLDAATKAAADIDASYNRTLTDAALSDALTKAGVTQPVHIKAAKAMLASQLQVSADDSGTRTVKAGDKGLADFIKEWAGSDEGKFFVTAQHSSGGGAGGHSGGGGKAETLTEQAMRMKAQAST